MKAPIMAIVTLVLAAVAAPVLAAPPAAAPQDTQPAPAAAGGAETPKPATRPYVKIIVEPPKINFVQEPSPEQLVPAVKAVSQALNKQGDGKQAVSQKDIDSLGTMTVQGNRISPICVLSFLKFALHNSYSEDPMKAGEVVCRMKPILGSRTQLYLFCETNGHRTARYRNQQAHGVSFTSATHLMQKLVMVNSPGRLRQALELVPAQPLSQCNS